MPQQKKKTRQSGQQAKQHLQQQRNLQRKEYFAKLYELCKRFGVDKEVKEFIEDIGPSYYMLRLAGIRVFASKDSVKLTQKEEAFQWHMQEEIQVVVKFSYVLYLVHI